MTVQKKKKKKDKKILQDLEKETRWIICPLHRAERKANSVMLMKRSIINEANYPWCRRDRSLWNSTLSTVWPTARFRCTRSPETRLSTRDPHFSTFPPLLSSLSSPLLAFFHERRFEMSQRWNNERHFFLLLFFFFEIFQNITEYILILDVEWTEIPSSVRLGNIDGMGG